MAFRELRDFTEQLRALGYPRRVSVDSFRKPNFPLVADVLYWLVHKYDPLVRIQDKIETEQNRVEFLQAVVKAVARGAHISMKPRNLYHADGRAVKEMLKLTRVMYDSLRVAWAEQDGFGDDREDEDIDHSAELTARAEELGQLRQLSRDITEAGARLYDLLEQEENIRAEREKALRFLDGVSSTLDSRPRSEQDHVEKSIREAIARVKEGAEQLERQCRDLEADKKQVETKLEKRKAELERAQKRLASMANVRMPFMDEYEALEKELAEEYELYVQKHRNLDFLERELDLFDKREQGKIQASNRALQRLQKKLRDEEMREFRGDETVDDDTLGMPSGGRAGGAAGGGRPGAATGSRRGRRGAGGDAGLGDADGGLGATQRSPVVRGRMDDLGSDDEGSEGSDGESEGSSGGSDDDDMSEDFTDEDEDMSDSVSGSEGESSGGSDNF